MTPYMGRPAHTRHALPTTVAFPLIADAAAGLFRSSNESPAMLDRRRFRLASVATIASSCALPLAVPEARADAPVANGGRA
jgi:hypothetical protein